MKSLQSLKAGDHDKHLKISLFFLFKLQKIYLKLGADGKPYTCTDKAATSGQVTSLHSNYSVACTIK